MSFVIVDSLSSLWLTGGCRGRCSGCSGSGCGGRDALGLDEVPQESIAADEDRRTIFVGYHLDGIHTKLIVPHFNILCLL